MYCDLHLIKYVLHKVVCRMLEYKETVKTALLYINKINYN